jgi:hypothetical protein
VIPCIISKMSLARGRRDLNPAILLIAGDAVGADQDKYTGWRGIDPPRTGARQKRDI